MSQPPDVEMAEAPPTEPVNAGIDLQGESASPGVTPHISTTPPPIPTPSTNTAPSNTSNPGLGTISNNREGFKYKYPQAKPTPPGTDDTAWNKIFTAADSRLYNRAGKNAAESRKHRESGATRKLALTMLEEKIAKDGAEAVTGGSGGSAPKISAPKKAQPAAVKKESSTGSRDATPSIEKMTTMSISEKIKSEGRARKAPSAAPSDRGTPAPASANAMGSPAVPPPAPTIEKPKKKGTAAPVKKQVQKPKFEDKASTPSSSRRTSQTPGPRNGQSSDDESNDGGEYCLCRGPDDHRMMVFCDGGCDDWYHCSCLEMDVEDARQLLDRFICPKCATDTLFTTWKRMCRYYNVGIHLNDPANPPCRKAAAIPSKYCSPEHAKMFFEFVKTLVRQDDEPSRGGTLNVGEVGWILSQTKTAAALHALGAKPRLPIKEGADLSRPPGLDYLAPEEERELEIIKLRKEDIRRGLQGYKNQEKLRLMIEARAEKAARHLGVKSVKDICGYDNRLVFNEAEFARWSATEEGKTALESGVLGPRTAETKSIGAHVLMPGQATPEVAEVADVLNNICTKAPKKCIKHGGWPTVHKDSFSYSHNLLLEEQKKLSAKEKEIIDDAETREATKDAYADNVTIQLF